MEYFVELNSRNELWYVVEQLQPSRSERRGLSLRGKRKRVDFIIKADILGKWIGQ